MESFRRTSVALIIACAMLSPQKAAAIYCDENGAGVGGLIDPQYDLARAFNCLGSQIASLNNRTASQASVLLLQRQIRELQDAYNALNRRVIELENAARR